MNLATDVVDKQHELPSAGEKSLRFSGTSANRIYAVHAFVLGCKPLAMLSTNAPASPEATNALT